MYELAYQYFDTPEQYHAWVHEITDDGIETSHGLIAWSEVSDGFVHLIKWKEEVL